MPLKRREYSGINCQSISPDNENLSNSSRAVTDFQKFRKYCWAPTKLGPVSENTLLRFALRDIRRRNDCMKELQDRLVINSR